MRLHKETSQRKYIDLQLEASRFLGPYKACFISKSILVEQAISDWNLAGFKIAFCMNVGIKQVL